MGKVFLKKEGKNRMLNQNVLTDQENNDVFCTKIKNGSQSLRLNAHTVAFLNMVSTLTQISAC